MADRDRDDRLIDLVRAHGTATVEVLSREIGVGPSSIRRDLHRLSEDGVPAITFRAGRDLVDGGLAAGVPIVADYNAKRYHQPSDEFDPTWTFAGTAQEASVAFALGTEVANSTTWPGWNPGAEYAPLRDATAAMRGTR